MEIIYYDIIFPTLRHKERVLREINSLTSLLMFRYSKPWHLCETLSANLEITVSTEKRKELHIYVTLFRIVMLYFIGKKPSNECLSSLVFYMLQFFNFLKPFIK